MITVAVHDNLALLDGDVHASVKAVAGELGIGPVSTMRFTSAIDLLDSLSSNGECSIDLIVFPQQMAGTSGLGGFMEIREIYPLVRGMMFADSNDQAMAAAQAGVSEFLLVPPARQELSLKLGRQLEAIGALHRRSFVMNNRGKASRVLHSQVVYCMTSGHDQEVHLKDGQVLAGRYSSQALFDLIGNPAAFFKAGRSYILNLDEVVEARSSNGLATMSNGTHINIPSRIRKSFEDALLFGQTGE